MNSSQHNLDIILFLTPLDTLKDVFWTKNLIRHILIIFAPPIQTPPLCTLLLSLLNFVSFFSIKSSLCSLHIFVCVIFLCHCWPARDHSLKANWHALSWQLSFVNNCLVRGLPLCTLHLSMLRFLSSLKLHRFCAWCQTTDKFICCNTTTIFGK